MERPLPGELLERPHRAPLLRARPWLPAPDAFGVLSRITFDGAALQSADAVNDSLILAFDPVLSSPGAVMFLGARLNDARASGGCRL